MTENKIALEDDEIKELRVVWPPKLIVNKHGAI